MRRPPSPACTFVQKSCSASVLEAIFRRLRSLSPYADRLSTTCARRRLDRTPFDARSHRTRPAIRGMFAYLSTLTRACRTAIASVHIFRRPRSRSPHDARLFGAHRCACVRRTLLLGADFRSRPMMSGSAVVFSTRASGLLDSSRCLPAFARIFRCSLAPPPQHRSPR